MPSLDTILTAIAAEPVPLPRDLSKILPKGERHPMDRPLGPLKPRGDASGLVLRAGKEIGAFGDVDEPEVTFSVAKSYLSALAGIAVRDGLITDLDEPVARKVHDGGFDSGQNAAVTWAHLLQQTSEWEGELFGLPDWLDRGRVVGGADGGGGQSAIGGTVGGTATGHRELGAPGSYWEYNDVRVNRLSLALLRLFEEPLPAVLKREVMDPIGASDSWSWHGYETSTVDVNGTPVESVSGGTHWGGGLWISARDHARLGQLYLNEGRAGDTQILPPGWTRETRTPSTLNPGYGLLWWLNAEGALSTVADETAFAAKGAGGHTIFVWPERDVVIVLRWVVDGVAAIDRILEAL